MKNTDAEFDRKKKLRERALALLRKDPQGMAELSSRDIAELTQELGVYQIELEMQNEELLKTQITLENSRQKYSDLYDFSPIGYFVLDKDGVIQEGNLTGATLLGVERSAMIGKHFFKFVHPEDQEKYSPFRRRVAETDGGQTLELRLLKKNADAFHASLQGRAVPDSDGDGVQCRIAVTDITERKQSDEALAGSEKKFKAIFDNVTDGVVITDPETRKFHDVNKHLCRMLGYSLEELKQLGVADIHPKEDLPYIFEQIEKQAGDTSLPAADLPVKRKDGSVFYASVLGTKINLLGKDYMVGVFRDITDRKQAEDKTKQEQILNNTIIESIPGTFYMLDGDGRYFRWSAYQRDVIVGKPESEVAKTYALDTIHPDDRELIRTKIENVLKNGIEEIVEGRVLLHGGPDFIWMLMTGRRIILRGDPFLIGIGIDITERRRAEESLRESEKKFMDVLYASNDAMLLIDGEKFVDCNEATAKMLGYPTRKEFLMTHPSELSPPEQSDGRSSFEKANEMMKCAYEQGFNRFEWIHKKASGENFPVEVSLTPVSVRGKNILHCLWRDLSGMKNAEKESVKRTHELEVFYKASIGREVVILELKKKILKLEEGLKAK